MKRTLLSMLALFFPWSAFLIIGKPISALAALALQLTFVGWLPASLWAWTEIKRAYLLNPESSTISAQTPIGKRENIKQDAAEKQEKSQPNMPTSAEKGNDNQPYSQQP